MPSVVTVIETDTETAVFWQNLTETAVLCLWLTVRFWNGAAVVSWTFTVGCSLQVVSPTRLAGGCYRWDQRRDRRRRRPCTPRATN